MTLDRDLVAAALPSYEIDDEIGRGGWGVVLHGRHRALGREVAIKQLPRALALNESALERFVSEARIIGQLDHPHIVKVYDFVEHEGLWLMVMEYLSGGTLWSRFTNDGLRSDQACAITMAVCAGLDEANQHGVLHRDIKPENILFTHEGVPRLGDFGIAKDLDSDLRQTKVGEVVGTPTYMSPEQATGDELTRACDVYSLAVVLYELLAGRLPFEEARTPTQQLIQHVTEQPIVLAQIAPEVPGAIGNVVMDALEKKPEDRTATAQAFGVALARAAGEAYGPGWLQQSGVPLMGGGRIQAAAHRGPTMGAPTRAPTLAQPAVRSDHFRPVDEIGLGSAPSPPTGFTAAAAATVGPRQEPLASEQPPTISTPTPLPPSASETTSAAAAGPPSERRSRRPLLIGTLFAALALLIVLAVVLSSRGDEGVATDEDSAAATAASATDTPATAAPAAAVAATSPPATASPTTTPTTQPAAEAAPLQGHTCPEATRCTFIDSVAIDGDSLVVEWTAIGFEPSYADGFVHAHFFWDIYSADQAGSNAATFGVALGAWEITDQQPFRSAGEMRVSNRPVPANQICVTAANFAHAVVNPLQFDCIPIPEGI